MEPFKNIGSVAVQAGVSFGGGSESQEGEDATLDSHQAFLVDLPSFGSFGRPRLAPSHGPYVRLALIAQKNIGHT